MTLSSRHRVRNSSPGGLRPSTLLLGHAGSPQYWLSHVVVNRSPWASMKRSPNVGLMLDQRHRRRPNVKPALGQRFASAGRYKPSSHDLFINFRRSVILVSGPAATFQTSPSERHLMDVCLVRYVSSRTPSIIAHPSLRAVLLPIRNPVTFCRPPFIPEKSRDVLSGMCPQ